jgi:hypothetical protein
MSITLQNAGINQLIVGGVTVETDAASAVTDYAVDLQAGTLTVTLKKGTATGTVFAPGQITSGNVQVIVNLLTGAWTSYPSGLSGTLGASALSTLQAQVVGDRNLFETFAVGNNIMPGTQVPWTSTAV